MLRQIRTRRRVVRGRRKAAMAMRPELRQHLPVRIDLSFMPGMVHHPAALLEPAPANGRSDQRRPYHRCGQREMPYAERLVGSFHEDSVSIGSDAP